MRRRGGWVFMDVLCALMVIAMLAGIAAVGIHQQSVALQRLENIRAASRLAEAVLLLMQSGEAPPKSREGSSWSMKTMSDSSGVAGMKWVQVEAKVDRGAASLIGLAPQQRAGGQP
jgi:hypothetical protein